MIGSERQPLFSPRYRDPEEIADVIEELEGLIYNADSVIASEMSEATDSRRKSNLNAGRTSGQDSESSVYLRNCLAERSIRIWREKIESLWQLAINQTKILAKAA
jgi:hypothetical protein